MKYFYLTIQFALSLSCSSREQKEEMVELQEKVVKPELQQILDSADVRGSILIYDLKEAVFYSNDFAWTEKGNLPASTYKTDSKVYFFATNVEPQEAFNMDMFAKIRSEITLKALERLQII